MKVELGQQGQRITLFNADVDVKDDDELLSVVKIVGQAVDLSWEVENQSPTPLCTVYVEGFALQEHSSEFLNVAWLKDFLREIEWMMP